MSTENIIHALDVSENSQTSAAWEPVVLKPVPFASALSWVVPKEKPEPQLQRTVSEPLPEPPVEVPLRPNASFEEMVDHHPKVVARAVEALLEQDKTADGLNQVAVLMIGLGAQRAAHILRLFPDADTARITKAVANFKTITEQQKKDVFEMFRQRLLSGDVILHGGVDFARDMLHKAFGPKQGDDFLSRVLPEESSGFYLIREATVEQLLPFVSKEHPQAIALILSQLDADQAAGVLNRLPIDLQVDVAYRIAKMDNISPQVMRELESSLAQDLRGVMSGQITEIGGPKAVAEILNRASRNTEKEILERLDAQDVELAEEVRNQMFVFDDIFNLSERDFQTVIGSVETQEWAAALKGASDQCFQCMDKEHVEKIKHIQKDLGPVRMSQIEEAQIKVVQKVRELEEAGKITIERVDADDVIL